MDDVIARGGEKKRQGKRSWGREEGRKGEGREEEDQGRQAPRASPGTHLDPPLATKVTGRLHLTSSLQKSRRCDCGPQCVFAAPSTQPVTCPSPSTATVRHAGGVRDVPETV